MLRTIAMLSLALALAAGAPACAQTIIGNLPTNDIGGSGFGATALIAFGFDTGATAQTLTSAVLRLSWTTTAPELVLRDAIGTNPGANVLATFVAPGSPGTLGSHTFTPTAPFTLQESTRYFLTGTFTSSGNWYGSNPGVTPTGTGATFFGYKSSSNGGASWVSLPTVVGYGVQLNGSPASPAAVPEPSSAVMLLPAMAGIAFFRRRTNHGGE